MKYLIDTHTFIWFTFSPEKISEEALNTIENPENEIYVSTMTFWEISIKVQKGKLDLQGIDIMHLPHIAEEYDFKIVNPDPYDYVAYVHLPKKENHRDPFDRMLIHQAIRDDFVLISKDDKYPQYIEDGLQLLW